MNFKTLVVSAICSQFLVACGGGGGGGSSAPVSGSGTPAVVGGPTSTPDTTPTPSTPGTSLGPAISVDAAFSDLYVTPRVFKRTEQDPQTGITYYAVADFQPGPDTTIEGVRVKATSIYRTLRLNGPDGAIVDRSAETRYFQTAPYKLIAVQSLDSTFYRVASAQRDLPALGYAGQSAAFYNAKDYDSNAKQKEVASSTNQWEITADSQVQLSFCINSSATSPVSPGTISTKDCYKISTVMDGQPSVVKAVGFVIPRR